MKMNIIILAQPAHSLDTRFMSIVLTEDWKKQGLTMM